MNYLTPQKLLNLQLLLQSKNNLYQISTHDKFIILVYVKFNLQYQKHEMFMINGHISTSVAFVFCINYA